MLGKASTPRDLKASLLSQFDPIAAKSKAGLHSHRNMQSTKQKRSALPQKHTLSGCLKSARTMPASSPGSLNTSPVDNDKMVGPAASNGPLPPAY